MSTCTACSIIISAKLTIVRHDIENLYIRDYPKINAWCPFYADGSVNSDSRRFGTPLQSMYSLVDLEPSPTPSRISMVIHSHVLNWQKKYQAGDRAV